MHIRMHKKLASDSLIEGAIWRKMLLFFLPIMCGTILQQLYNMADTVIVSIFVGKQALAAVGGSSAIITSLLVNFFVAMSSGASVIISQNFGAGERENVRRSLQNAMVLALASGTLLTVVGIAAARPLLELLGTTADTIDYSTEYLQYYFAGMIPSMIYNMGSGLLRAMGDSKKPLQFLAVAAALNVVLDLLFVVTFQMAVIGAAVATTLSQVVSAILVLRALSRLPEDIRPNIRHLRLDGGMLKRMLQIGLPSGISSSMYSIANMVVQSGINKLGTDVVAGWSAYNKLDNFFWPISSAIGITVMTFVGQNYGAKRYDRVRDTIRTGIKMHLALSALLGVAVILFRYPLISIFAKGDAAVLAAGVEVSLYTCAFYFTFCCTEIFSATMRAVGNAVKPTVITLCCVCLFRVVYLAAYGLEHASILTIAICFPTSWALSSLVFLIYYKSRRWMPKELREQLATVWAKKKKAARAARSA